MMRPLATLRLARARLYAQREHDALVALYRKYASFTMIPEREYVLNLQLAEMARPIAGAVVECGVWRGGMIAGISELLGDSREYVLCDSFEGLPQAQAVDGPAALEWQSDTTAPTYYDNCTAQEGVARAAMALSPARRVRFVSGWFESTLPLVDVADGIALLRLDADWHASTTTCLEHLYHRVVPGGLIVVDDYYTWDGCARALHEFLARGGITTRIHQWKNVICYLRVPEGQLR